MKKYLLILGMFFSVAAFAGDKGKLTGYISDSHCGAKGNSPDHAECAKKCIKEGFAPVLVVGDKVYTINNPKKVADFIGEKVTVTGTITDDAVDIKKITK